MRFWKGLFHNIKKEIPLYLLLAIVVFLEGMFALIRGFFIDEFFSWCIVKRPLSQMFFLKQFRRWYMNSFPPFYEVVVNLFSSLFPHDSELIFRIPAIICFVLLIFVSYKLTFLLSKNRWAAFLSSFFIAGQPVYFLYGHMLRGYMFFSLCSLLSFYIIYLFLSSEYQKKFLFFLGFLYVVMFYTHYLSFYIVFSQLLFLRIHFHNKTRKDLVPYLWEVGVIPLIIFMPWFPNFVFDLWLEHSIGSGPQFIGYRIPAVIKSFGTREGLLFLFNFAIFIFGSVKIAKLFPRRSIKRNFVIFLTWFFIGYFLLIILISRYPEDMFNFDKNSLRYMLAGYFVVFIVNAVFISIYLRKKSLLLFIMALYLAAYFPYVGFKMPIVEPVAEYLKKELKEKQGKTALLFEDVMDIPGFLYYFSSPKDALAATEGFYGNIWNVEAKFKKRGIDIKGNIVGAAYYVNRNVLHGDFEQIIIVDNPYFCQIRNGHPVGECSQNFSEEFDNLIKKYQFRYSLTKKKMLPDYSVWVYKKKK